MGKNNEVHSALDYHTKQLKTAKSPLMKKHHSDQVAKLAKIAGGTSTGRGRGRPAAKTKVPPAPKARSRKAPKAAMSAAMANATGGGGGNSDDMSGMSGM